jgi:hypothetical protein
MTRFHIPRTRITHALECAWHSGAECDCDRDELWDTLVRAHLARAVLDPAADLYVHEAVLEAQRLSALEFNLPEDPDDVATDFPH